MLRLIRRFILLTACCFGLVSCESMQPSECATVDWMEKGRSDAQAGRTDRAADYHESCSKAGIGINLAAYRQGRDLGLEHYCKLNNALDLGLAGSTYYGICKAERDQEFRKVHSTGMAHYEAQARLRRLNEDQRKLEGRLADPKLTDAQRAEVRQALRNMDRSLSDTRFEVSRIERDVEFLRRQVVGR